MQFDLNSTSASPKPIVNTSNMRRRFSLPEPQPQQLGASQKYSFLNKQPPPPQLQPLLQQSQLISTPDLFSNFDSNPYAKLLQNQLQQPEDNLTSLLKIYNQYQPIDLSPPIQDLNEPFNSLFLNQQKTLFQQQQQQQQQQNLINRRRSYCVGNTTLRPVLESRSTSPFQYHQQQQQQQQQQQELIQQQLIEQKLNLLQTNSVFMSPQSTPQQTRKLSLPVAQNFDLTKSRLRASSMSSMENKTLFTPISLQNKLDTFEEKLATTGNIFQRRDDWYILNRLPINKQNTIHIRVEDEGPYGNDETRCFVLSHFSSLGIKELSCIFCGCDLIIYDRFPLTDGTLFVSPFMYDKLKSVPAIVSNKQQYINGVCVNCLNGDKNHEIKCKWCKKSWSSIGGFSLQVGTLYKYDIFAAFPCCQKRLNCLKCDKKLIDYEHVQDEYFSYFSEEKECLNCKTKALHFLRPLKDVYLKSQCELNRENNKENVLQNKNED